MQTQGVEASVTDIGCARTPNLNRNYSIAHELAQVHARPSTIHRLSGVSKEAAKGIYTLHTGSPPPRGKLVDIHLSDQDQMRALLMYCCIFTALSEIENQVRRMIEAFRIYSGRASELGQPELCPDTAFQMIHYLENEAWYLVSCCGQGCGTPLLVQAGPGGARPRRVKCTLCAS